MTEDEKRQQKAMLLLDHQEAEQNLAHLREKATKISSPFNDLANWLSWGAMEYAGGHEEDKKKLNAAIRSNIDAYRAGTDFNAALKLMDEIVQAERNVNDLRQRKQNLGLK